jgi:hypothetical protein
MKTCACAAVSPRVFHGADIALDDGPACASRIVTPPEENRGRDVPPADVHHRLFGVNRFWASLVCPSARKTSRTTRAGSRARRRGSGAEQGAPRARNATSRNPAFSRAKAECNSSSLLRAERGDAGAAATGPGSFAPVQMIAPIPPCPKPRPFARPRNQKAPRAKARRALWMATPAGGSSNFSPPAEASDEVSNSEI